MKEASVCCRRHQDRPKCPFFLILPHFTPTVSQWNLIKMLILTQHPQFQIVQLPFWLWYSLSPELCQVANASWDILPISRYLSGSGLWQPAVRVYECIVSWWIPTLYIPFVTQLHNGLVKMLSVRSVCIIVNSRILPHWKIQYSFPWQLVWLNTVKTLISLWCSDVG